MEKTKEDNSKKLFGTPLVVIAWMVVIYSALVFIGPVPSNSKEEAMKIMATKQKVGIVFIIGLPIAIVLTKINNKNKQI